MKRPNIKGIRVRRKAATGGPWEAVPETKGVYVRDDSCCADCEMGEQPLAVDDFGDGSIRHTHSAPSHQIVSADGAKTRVAGNYDYEEGGIIEHADTVFIAHARQDVEDLLEYIEDLEKDRRSKSRTIQNLKDQIRALRAQLEGPTAVRHASAEDGELLTITEEDIDGI